jgi:uncharacterized small protein (DUF1192 family)
LEVVPITEIQIKILAARVALLRHEVARLGAELTDTRLESANRLAAMRAALRAEYDGEASPLDYLRDEIGDYPPPDRGRP